MEQHEEKTGEKINGASFVRALGEFMARYQRFDHHPDIAVHDPHLLPTLLSFRVDHQELTEGQLGFGVRGVGGSLFIPSPQVLHSNARS